MQNLNNNQIINQIAEQGRQLSNILGDTFKIACTYSNEAHALEFSPLPLSAPNELMMIGDDKLIGVWVIEGEDLVSVLGMLDNAFHQNMKLKNKAKFLAQRLDNNFKRFSLLDIN